MKKYVVTAVKISFGPGAVLSLTPDLAAPRLHNLQKLNRDLYEVQNTVEFKRGEVLGYGGDVNKLCWRIWPRKVAMRL